MREHISVQSNLSRAACRHVQLLVGSLSAALVVATIFIFVGLEVPTATARLGIEFSGDTTRQIVNRTGKSDRQDLAIRLNARTHPESIDALQAPAGDLKLLIGCESMISPLAHPLLSRVARRCLS